MQVKTNNKPLSCPECASKEIKKHSISKTKLQVIQRYFCKNCRKTFTLKPAESKGKSYPLQLILQSLSLYSLGNSQADISEILSKKFEIRIPQKTISNWTKEFKQTTTFSRLRREAKSEFSPENIIESYELLHNNLNYKYQIHNFKLNYLTNNNEKLQRLKIYLEKIPTSDFPHHIFKPNYNTEQKLDRSSQVKFETLNINPLRKQNLANKLCQLALNLARTNRERHQAVQDFFITNDSTTIATEIPVYLTHDDLLYFNANNFSLNPEVFKTPVTGHIDILQIRNNLIHILDYKPEASRINPTHQLTVYALALASRTKLPLTSFKAAWFDESNYYEFFPLHSVFIKKEK